MATIELATIEEFIYLTCINDATLMAFGPTAVEPLLLPLSSGNRVYGEEAPQQDLTEIAWPIIIFQWQGDIDVKAVPRVTIWNQATYLIKAVKRGRSNGPPLSSIVYRLKQLFANNNGGNTSNGQVYESQVISNFKQSETVNGEPYRHLGILVEFKAV